MFRIFALMLLLIARPGWAEPALAPVPDPPDLPPVIESGEPMEPDVTVIRRGEEQIEEYRVNDRLHMVKVKPIIGPPYYLVDSDGDGNVDVRRSDTETGLNINKWLLLSW